ncbi:MAG: hypothetical protein AMXMBFR33_49700 [Candidatus Xenobia bacterium]
MRGMLVAVLLWCLVAAGQAQPARVTFRTIPTGAQVNDQYGPLGVSGQPLVLRPADQYAGGIYLTFKSPGYHDLKQTLTFAMVARSDETYPPPGEAPLSLKPASPAAFASYYRAPLGLLLGGVAVAGAWLTRLRRREQRVKKLTEVLDQDATASMVEAIPGRLGDYQLLDKLGGGGMATVYRALKGDEQVAIKVLRHEAHQDTDFQARFRREADLYRQLHHPHVVMMLDYGQQRDLYYLVLELMEGGTLTQKIPPQGMPPEEAARILEPLGQAVQAAHDQGVVHRDLKPDNVMLTARGVLKVTDFGLGRSLTSTHLTATGTALGTPAYMAPEQVCGVLFEPATDQYALGIIAFELLTGKRPFEAVDPIQACFMHVSEPAPAPGVSPEVDAVILRMLAKKPEERYATVADAMHELLAALKRV